MRFFLKFSLILTICLFVSLIFLPRAYQQPFPRHPGPVFDRQVRADHLENINTSQSQIVLVGDSTLVLGMDTQMLASQTGRSVYSMGVPGSASALWYLIVKNTIAETTTKPELVVVVFRDTILTAPGYRVHGSYFELLDEHARRNEPVLLEKAFINQMNPLEYAAEKYFPLYVFRSNIRAAIDGGIRYFAPSQIGCNRDCTDFAFGELFQGANMEPGVLVNAVDAAESLLYTPEQLDFEKQVESSFLPDMLAIANENGFDLMFVRIKVESGVDSPALDQYLADLEQYFGEKAVHYLDLGDDPRFTGDMFSDSIHLNELGKALFTQLVADEIIRINVGK